MSCFTGFTEHQLKLLLSPLKELKTCSFCPHKCNADRTVSSKGICKSTAGFSIASIIAHHGEEPAISGENGICNVFFSHCNLQCVYCQNYQISNNSQDSNEYTLNLDMVIVEILKCLDKGCHAVGFVSPSHMIPQMLIIINALKLIGRKPVYVYNSNAYDDVDVLKSLEGIIDVYLPDFKYIDASLSKKFSGVENYPLIAAKAIKEMFRQKGASLHLDENGRALSGLMIRHLVLPGQVENSKNVLRFISEELSPKVSVSLMAQYYPAFRSTNYQDLNRTLFSGEYSEVKLEFEKLHFQNGYVQELESSSNYIPDFQQDLPFQ